MVGFSFLRAKKMQYTKTALDIPSILARLEHKGLVISDRVAATRALTFIGYFRLKGYALRLMDQAPAGFAHGSRVFKPGTTFDDLLGLYEFDRSLRIMLMEQLDRIEVAARTVIINALNIQHGPHWYSNFQLSIVTRAEDQSNWFNSVTTEIHRSKEQFIQHYFSTYTQPRLPPSWAVAECLSFGKWSKLYSQLTMQKSAIAAEFQLTPSTLQSWLHSLSYLRNACAHHARLTDRKLPFPPAAHPHYKTHFPPASMALYPRFAAIRVLTNSIDGNSLFTDGLRYLFYIHPNVASTSLGFPGSWETDPLWI